MIRKLKYLLLSTVIVLLCVGCSSDKNDDEEVLKVNSSVLIQTAGIKIEGLTICLEDTCKTTDKEGAVKFKKNGTYTFRLNNLHLASLDINTSKVLITPYILFDTNDTMAQWFELCLHAFDKKNNFDTYSVTLTDSTYIPLFDDFQMFIKNNKINNNLSYTVNEHTTAIDSYANIVIRDEVVRNIPLISSSTYKQLEELLLFILAAESKEIQQLSTGKKFSFTTKSLNTFLLGENYEVKAQVEDDEIILLIYNNVTEITKKAHVIDLNNTTLVTNIEIYSIVN